MLISDFQHISEFFIAILLILITSYSSPPVGSHLTRPVQLHLHIRVVIDGGVLRQYSYIVY